MRFDSTPYYHVGEDYSWQTLVREMREEVRLMDQGGFTGLWSPSTIRLGRLVPCPDRPHPRRR